MTPAALRRWRDRKGWTQEQAASALGFTERHYKRLEAGESPIHLTVELACKYLETHRPTQDVEAHMTERERQLTELLRDMAQLIDVLRRVSRDEYSASLLARYHHLTEGSDTNG